MNGEDDLGRRVRAMRASFDAAFAQPLEERAEAPIELLLLRAGEEAFAVRTRELAEVFRTPPITSLPSRAPALVGLIGHRATLVALYGLAALVTPGAAAVAGDWSVALAGAPSIAFCFDDFDGTVRVFEDDLLGAGEAEASVVRIDGVPRRLLAVPSLLAALAPGTEPTTEPSS